MFTYCSGDSIYFFNKNITGRSVEEIPTSHTQAVCNETDNGKIYCEDYEIICKNGNAESITPTGFAVYHPENWKDPRGENGNIIICN